MKQLILEIRHDQAAWFEENLSMYDITGLEIINDQDPAYTTSNWYWDEAYVPPVQETVLVKIYGDDFVLQDIEEMFKHEVIRTQLIEVEEENWNAKWAESFRGFPVGQRLYIQPTHDLPSETRINILIEAGMAFGTGTHETTLGCLEALERYLQPGNVVLDVGSGSGILSIASVKLGAHHVTAVEIDETALSNAEENRRINQVEDSITQLAGDLLSTISQPADVLVANILPEVLVRMYDDALRLLPEGGLLILSGILSERVEIMLNRYHDGFLLLEQITKGDWNTLVFVRTDA